MKWRDALVRVGEVGAGLGSDKTHASPLQTTGCSLGNVAGRRTLSKAISRYRGATHLDKGLQEELLARMLARQVQSAASHAGAEPTASDHADEDEN